MPQRDANCHGEWWWLIPLSNHDQDGCLEKATRLHLPELYSGQIWREGMRRAQGVDLAMSDEEKWVRVRFPHHRMVPLEKLICFCWMVAIIALDYIPAGYGRMRGF